MAQFFRMLSPLAVALVAAGLLSLGAAAQAGVYKWVDANGKVTYSDVPPPEQGKAKRVEDKMSVYTPPSEAKRQADPDASLRSRVASLEQDVARARGASQDQRRAAEERARLEYDRCVRDRRIDCDDPLRGTSPGAGMGSTVVFVPTVRNQRPIVPTLPVAPPAAPQLRLPALMPSR
jgi:hypothetical protein